MKGKLIVIEGTDCSGKETQSDKLIERLKKDGVRVEKIAFPMYDTPTGKIVGGPYLGKEYICHGWFNETAPNVDPKVAALYFAADRRYNMPKIKKLLDDGVNIIADRYVYSNMAHQGGKIEDTNERMNMYAWLDVLEFKLLELPKPDIAIFLHMPYEFSKKLKENRAEAPDEHELNEKHLKMAENAYVELSSVYKWETVECATDTLKTVDEINDEVYKIVKEKLNI